MKIRLVILLFVPICSFSQQAYCDNGKFGFKEKGVVIIEPMYDYAADFNSGLACVKKDEHWGYINRKNVWLSGKYDRAQQVMSGYGRVLLNGMFGLVDSLGKEVLPPVYESIIYRDGLYEFSKESLNGLICGAIQIPCKYASIGYNRNGYAYGYNEDKSYDIYDTGGLVLSGQSVAFSDWNIQKDGNIVASKDGLFGIFNTVTKKWVLKPKYPHISTFYTTGYKAGNGDSATYNFVYTIFIDLKDEKTYMLDQETKEKNNIILLKASSLEKLIENITGYRVLMGDYSNDWQDDYELFTNKNGEPILLNTLLKN